MCGRCLDFRVCQDLAVYTVHNSERADARAGMRAFTSTRDTLCTVLGTSYRALVQKAMKTVKMQKQAAAFPMRKFALKA
jgi:hypothetical protein